VASSEPQALGPIAGVYVPGEPANPREFGLSEEEAADYVETLQEVIEANQPQETEDGVIGHAPLEQVSVAYVEPESIDPAVTALLEKSKDELVALADEHDVDVAGNASKKTIAEALVTAGWTPAEIEPPHGNLAAAADDASPAEAAAGGEG